MRGKTAVALMLSALVAGLLSLPADATDVPGTTCPVFPADNAWHLHVARLPVHAKSRMWKKATHAGSTFLHPDFGPLSYGIPFDLVSAAHPKVSIAFTYASESDPGPYPVDSDTTIEGGSDRHAIMIDQSDCTLYELWNAR